MNIFSFLNIASVSNLFAVLKNLSQVFGCLFLIKFNTLTVNSASKIAECAPDDSNPFILAKDSSFMTAFPLSFISVTKTFSSTAWAPLAIFNPSCLLLGDALVI